jgi:Integrase zinc binding domain
VQDAREERSVCHSVERQETRSRRQEAGDKMAGDKMAYLSDEDDSDDDDDANDNDNAEEKEDDEYEEEKEEEQEGQEHEEEEYTEDQITELHRAAFNTIYFDKMSNKTKFISDEDYDYIILCLQGFHNPDNPAEQKEFRRENVKSHHYIKIYELDYYTSAEGEECIQLLRKESSVGGTIVCKQSKVFDAIRDAHISTAHLAVANTLAQIQLKYWNITRNEVDHFVKVCPVCAFKRHKSKKPKGAKKPIMSEMFCDCFQVDLIDYTNMKCINHYGIEMKWLLVCKDHFSGFTVLAALPSKEAKHVIHELSYIFGLIGYPTFFHTDYGKEFVAKEVIKGIKDISITITSVTGHPRCPSDQGSVEKQNSLVKKIVLNLEQMGKGPWADNLGPVMSAMNAKPFGTGPSKISAYETVFGMPYGNTEQVPHDELRKCVTVKDRLQLVSSPRLKALAKDWYILDYESQDEVEARPDPPSSDAEDDGDTKPAAKPTPVKKKTAAKSTPAKQKPSRSNPSRVAKSPQVKVEVVVEKKKKHPRSRSW